MSLDPFLGEISLFAGNFAPRGWAFCDGQLLAIAQNTALFSILGTTYGGDGRTDFALPDLRGRAPIHEGQGPGLSNRQLGQRGGSEVNQLSVNQLPSHTHTASLNNLVVNGSVEIKIPAIEDSGEVTDPSDTSILAKPVDVNGNDVNLYSSQPSDITLKPFSAAITATATAGVTVGNTGGNSSVNNMQPFLVINYIIALEGVFPPRN